MFKSTAHFKVWVAGVSFVLFQFFLQLSSGIVIGAIMRDMHITALTAGFLGSSFYIMYTGLQIPVGVLFDKTSTRLLMTVNVFICSLGCFIFASCHSLTGLFLGRFLIGAGSAFAFVGFSHILRQHFPLKRFAFMIGFSETFAFFSTALGMIGMSSLLNLLGWRNFIFYAGILGLFITWLNWHAIPEHTPQPGSSLDFRRQIIRIASNKAIWINSLFVALSFTTVTVFGALWAIPFLQKKLLTSLPKASLLGALFFVGAGISCPLFGWLSSHVPRKPLILSSCVTTMLLLITIIYAPTQSYVLIGWLMFLIGCSCSAYMLAFAIANELAPKNALSTCAGFTNTLATLSAPLFQSLIGYLLVTISQEQTYTLLDYQYALLPLPLALFLACGLVLFLPEKYPSK